MNFFLVKIIPCHHLEFDHIKLTVKRLKQVDTGSWEDHAFTGFMEMYDHLKIRVKHPVVNSSAFWTYFSDQLKAVEIHQCAEAC